MTNIWTIAKNTFKLELRGKIVLGIIVFAILYILAEMFLSDLVFGELPMVKSFGLLGIYFFNAIIAIFLGTTAIFKDIEKKVVYFIFSRPVSRIQFLIGKFIGLCLVLLLTTVILGIAYLGLIAYEHGGFDTMGIVAILMQYLEMTIFIAFAIFVSTFSASMLAVAYTSIIFFVGHVVSYLIADAHAIKLGGIKLLFIEILYYVFPNLEKFDVRNIAIHNAPAPLSSFFLALAYAVVYIVALIAGSNIIFRRKEI